MSENVSLENATTTETATPEPAKTSPRKKSGKSKEKKAAKAKASTAKPDRSMAAETPAGTRRANLVRMLKRLGATSASAAQPIGTLAEKLGYTKFDAYGLVNGTSGKAGSAPNCLVATGHVKTVKHEGQGLCAYLSAKGKNADPAELANGKAKKE